MSTPDAARIVLDVDTRIYPSWVVEKALHAFSEALSLDRVESDGAWMRILAHSNLDARVVQGEFGNYLVYAFVASPGESG